VEAFRGLSRIRIENFRSLRNVTFDPGPLCALVGEAGAGKSNILAAVWKLLCAEADPSESDPTADGDASLVVQAVANGSRVSLTLRPGTAPIRTGAPPPAVFLPAAARSEEVAAVSSDTTGPAAEALELLRRPMGSAGASSARPALGFVEGLEACCAAEVNGVVLLVEEPELFLRPPAQRHLHRLLRDFAAAGNQVLYSTHAPAFLNVGRLEELALVSFREPTGTVIFQPRPLPADRSFRAVSEFDAERGELLLSRAALLVEGRTEKLAFPFVFRALGHDPDREGISIVECGGKPNIPLFARICDAVRVPYLVVHDRDAAAGAQPIQSERAVNAEIERAAGPARTVVLVPDFEAVADLVGRSHKPERAWRRFALEQEPIPDQLAEVVHRVVELATG
jgi:predicted ATP-dependent endonuclease of OLD family